MASLLDSPQSNSSIQSLLASKSTTQIAKDSAVKENKTAIVNATVLSVKPTTLGVGEVAKVTEKGKTVYYVGTATGGLSDPKKTISLAIERQGKEVNKAEKIQTTALEKAQKIEIAEIKQELKAVGLSTKDINAVVKSETAANKAENKQLTGLLGNYGLQHATRDANNAIVASSGAAAPLNSLLAYNDPAHAPKIQTNIKSANDEVAKFQTLYGINEPFYKQGSRVSIGLDPFAIYQAQESGKITFDAATQGYKKSDALSAFGGKQEGWMQDTDIGKGAARVLELIVSPGTTIGQKANVVKENGNYTLYSGTSGTTDPFGKQGQLIDTGKVDDQGRAIYTQESRLDTKYNKVGLTKGYVKDGENFTYTGVLNSQAQRIEKTNGFNPVQFALTALATIYGVPWIAETFVGPIMGLAEGAAASSVAANAVAGAIVGGAVAGVSGQNVLTGAALGALGAGVYKYIDNAVTAAGGWESFYDRMILGDTSLFENVPIPDIGPDVAAAGGAEAVVADVAQTTADLTNMGVDPTNPTASLGGAATSGIDFNAVTPGGPGINLNYGQTGQLASDLITSGLPAGLISPTPAPPSSLDILNNTQWANVGNQPPPPTPTQTPGLLDAATSAVKGAASDVWDYAKAHPLPTAIAAAGIVPPIVQAINQPEPPKDPIYTGPGLIPDPKYVNPPTPQTIDPATYTTGLIGANAPAAGGNWNQYYTNLFKRQGVGAGNYLGYDYMNRLGDIPQELMGLLGTGAPIGQTTSV